MKPYWTEPSSAEELAEAIKKQIEEARPSTHYTEKEFEKKGWDKTEEIHKRKEELFKRLNEEGLSPSEYVEIMKEINSL